MQEVYIEYLGDSMSLAIGETVIGRDVGCTLRFNDAAVSRRHLRFIRRQDEVFVEDLGSSNGTLLNGRQLAAPIRVVDGDVIRVGSRELTFHSAENDGTAESTAVLKSLEVAEPARPRHKMFASVTAQLAAVAAPKSAHQRCPQCAAPVSELDDECEKCHYRWGGFRPTSVTAVRPVPLNRRRHNRQSLELSILYVSSELEVEAMTRDLSESGVFVCSQVLDPIGTSCQMTILVDGGPPLQVGGVVRRVVDHTDADGEPIGLGVEFVAVGTNELAWIKTAVARIDGDHG